MLGDLVLTHTDGKLQMMVVMAHTGDHHHRFMAVEALSKNEDDGATPYTLVVAQPDRLYSGYWVGPALARLDMSQIVGLRDGIKIPPITVDVPLRTLLLIAERHPQPVERRASV